MTTATKYLVIVEKVFGGSYVGSALLGEEYTAGNALRSPGGAFDGPCGGLEVANYGKHDIGEMENDFLLEEDELQIVFSMPPIFAFCSFLPT